MTQVTCEEARLQMCADARTPSTQLREHLAECEDCRTYQSGMAVLEAGLRRAFEQAPPFPRKKPPVPLPKPEPVLPRARRRTAIRPRTWAMAASVLLAILGGTLLWTARATNSLAQDLSTHVTLEGRAWQQTQAVPPEEIQRVMSRAHLNLASGQSDVVFARTCFVHGHLVPHLVVRTPQGPIAVVVMPDEPVDSSRSFRVGNVTGVMLPAPRGSIAVLTQQPELSLDVARQLKDEVRWDNN